MPGGLQEHPENQLYVLPTAYDSGEEMQRLEDLHAAITQYFGGKLCLAPIVDMRPRRILDLGPAKMWNRRMGYPGGNAVPGCSSSCCGYLPLPNREIPVNMSFELADLTEEFTFDNETFDVVHSRMVMIHVPNGEDAVKRAAQLLKPGGLFLMEDLDFSSMVRTGSPSVQVIASNILRALSSRTADGELGRRLAGIITATGYFPHVNVHKIAVPLSGSGNNEAEKSLGAVFKRAWMQTSQEFGRRLGAEGFTEALIQEEKEELCGSDCKAVFDMYFCWALRN
ncbi:hypothetical protein B0H19DRAFT_1081216 [Mycena capillaripes]|nr:hypothetical protein B0H19DRAFT_1081216 [Mycena capillaripes]